MKYDDVSLWHRARLSPKKLIRYRAWRRDHRDAIRVHRLNPNTRIVTDDATHLKSAVQWLLHCQDIATDGGFIGRYRLDKGWSTSYPETTGYIIPTLLTLSEWVDSGRLELTVTSEELITRAIRAADFLISIQLACGAFPAGEIGTNAEKPSPFNTAQIINGLQQIHAKCEDEKYLQAAIRAARWLLEVQDDDGAWRQWFYHKIPATYCSHLACWVAELGSYLDEGAFKTCARVNAKWVLTHQDSKTGFFDKCGFTKEEQDLRIADLHTIAYNQAGLIRIGKALENEEIIIAAEHAANGVLNTLNRLAWLPGVLDHQWRSKANSACLTGCAQMALVWMALYKISPVEKYLSGAKRALQLVKRGQLLGVDCPALAGAIPGSDPLWGWYNDGIMPNWAAKFFIDASLDLEQAGVT